MLLLVSLLYRVKLVFVKNARETAPITGAVHPDKAFLPIYAAASRYNLYAHHAPVGRANFKCIFRRPLLPSLPLFIVASRIRSIRCLSSARRLSLSLSLSDSVFLRLSIAFSSVCTCDESRFNNSLRLQFPPVRIFRSRSASSQQHRVKIARFDYTPRIVGLPQRLLLPPWTLSRSYALSRKRVVCSNFATTAHAKRTGENPPVTITHRLLDHS